MNRQNPVSGVVLAGGMGRRVQQQDKGLLPFNDRLLVSHAIEAMAPLVDDLWLSANRNLERYRQLGYPVLTDQFGDFDGPLAGILAAMQHARQPWLLVLPCDSPLLGRQQLQRLFDAMTEDIDIAAAHDGERLHPVVALLRCALYDDLQAYLGSGQRRLQVWFERHRLRPVDFSDQPEVFANINTLEQLHQLAVRSNSANS